MFFFLLKFFKKNITVNNMVIKFSTQPTKGKQLTLLRAPFRHKLAKNHIGRVFFMGAITIIFKNNSSICVKTTNTLKLIFTKLINFTKLFGSNLIFQKAAKISLRLNFLNEWDYNY